MPFLVAYVSSATRPFTVAELAVLLDHSRQNNAHRGLTGALLYQDGNFMQVLEGPETAVRDLYAAIETDPRHHDVIEIFYETNAERQFEHWSMAFRNLSGDRSDLADKFDDYFELGNPGAKPASAGHFLLDSFRTTLNLRGAI